MPIRLGWRIEGWHAMSRNPAYKLSTSDLAVEYDKQSKASSRAPH